MQAAAGGDVLHHAAVFHRGPEDLARRVAPELASAVQGGEAVMASLEPAAWQALAAELGDVASSVRWLHADDRYATPAGAMVSLERFVRAALADGAPAVWSLGALRFDGTADDDRWIRYEHAVNDVLGHLPLHAICAYDVGTTSDEILAHAAASHAAVHGPVAPPTVPTPRVPPRPPIAVPSYDPTFDDLFEDTTSARAAVTAALDGSLPHDALDDVRLITSELVTNALRHGQPPARLAVWRSPAEVVVQVRDGGRGVTDPHAELRPPTPGEPGGRGLNIVAQLARLDFGHDDGGATVTALRALP